MFLWKDLIARNNSELLANLGNYINRVMKFIQSKYDSVVPECTVSGPMEVALLEDVNKFLTEYTDSLEAVKLRQGLNIAMAVSARGNQYLQTDTGIPLSLTLLPKTPTFRDLENLPDS